MTNVTRDCVHCRGGFTPKMKRSRFCSTACRDASYYAANRARVRAQQSEYYIANAPRIKDLASKYYADNREACTARNREYREAHLAEERERRKVNATKIRAQKRAWNEANRDLIREQRREYRARNADVLREYNRLWVSENLDKFKVYNHERRARLLSAPTIPFTNEQLASRLAAFGGLCWMCGAVGSTLDHVKPLIAGGSHMLSNLRPACTPCNSSKGPRWYGPPEIHRFLR